MNLDFTIKIGDVAIIIATLLAPLLAIQAQKFLERRREKLQRQTSVFRILMSTRLTTLSNEHVQALNAVPIEFYGTQKITTAWKSYLEHLGTQQIDSTVWGNRRVDLFMDLLRKIAVELGYDFDVVQLKNEFYAPKGHVQREIDDEEIRQGLLKVFSGKAALKMEVTGFPVDEEALVAQKDVQELTKSWLRGECTPRVQVETIGKP